MLSQKKKQTATMSEERKDVVQKVSDQLEVQKLRDMLEETRKENVELKRKEEAEAKAKAKAKARARGRAKAKAEAKAKAKPRLDTKVVYKNDTAGAEQPVMDSEEASKEVDETEMSVAERRWSSPRWVSL